MTTNPTAPWVVTHVAETGSTNADLAEAARRGAPHGTVLVTDVQHTGRGRLGRTWTAPAGTALLFSTVLRLERVPPAARGWTGAVLGLSIVGAIESRTGLIAELKWPNDVLISGRKVAGILAELVGDAVVVGAGINVSVRGQDLPRADATSLALSGAPAARCDRGELLAEVLALFAERLDQWQAADGDIDACGIRREYVERCGSVGAMVEVQLPDGGVVTGRAVDVSRDGAIVLDDGARRRQFLAGDVRHLRPAAPAISTGEI